MQQFNKSMWGWGVKKNRVEGKVVIGNGEKMTSLFSSRYNFLVRIYTISSGTCLL